MKDLLYNMNNKQNKYMPSYALHLSCYSDDDDVDVIFRDMLINKKREREETERQGSIIVDTRIHKHNKYYTKKTIIGLCYYY